jgi:DHA1 family tetracycline resistance protein-like MFS transporter
VGLTLAITGACSAIVQAGLIGRVVAVLKERRALLLGLMFGTIGFAIYALAPNGLLFAAGIPFTALWGFSGASCQSLMTRRVDPSEQGRLQGAISALRGLADMMGPGLFTASFALGIGASPTWELPQAPYLLATLISALSIVVAWIVARPAPHAAEVDSQEAPEPHSTSEDAVGQGVA